MDKVNYYSAPEVSKLLGVHVETVRRWLRSGKLGSSKPGRYLISAKNLQKFMNDHKMVVTGK